MSQTEGSKARDIFVPGNHDLRDLPEAYEEREDKDGSRVTVKTDKYPLRLREYSGFFHRFRQKPYPLGYAEQGMAIPFWETGIQFLTLNSCWQIDQYNRKRSGINPDALAQVIRDAEDQETMALRSGQFFAHQPTLRIGVWHHAVVGSEQMKNVEFCNGSHCLPSTFSQ
jgi:hypothetical protein